MIRAPRRIPRRSLTGPSRSPSPPRAATAGRGPPRPTSSSSPFPDQDPENPGGSPTSSNHPPTTSRPPTDNPQRSAGMHPLAALLPALSHLGAQVAPTGGGGT